MPTTLYPDEHAILVGNYEDSISFGAAQGTFTRPWNIITGSGASPQMCHFNV